MEQTGRLLDCVNTVPNFVGCQDFESVTETHKKSTLEFFVTTQKTKGGIGNVEKQRVQRGDLSKVL